MCNVLCKSKMSLLLHLCTVDSSSQVAGSHFKENTIHNVFKCPLGPGLGYNKTVPHGALYTHLGTINTR
jgi:hypothetical protein